MSRPTQPSVPGEHPDHDLLADLAAEVLAEDLAGQVQDHVIGCQGCASLLAEAEGVRSLLRQGEPARMPADVLARLERAVVEARAEDQATAATQGVPVTRPAADGLTDTSTRLMRPVGATGARRISRSAPATTAIPTAGGAASPPTGRLSRMSSRPAESARRQAREEAKADRPSRLVPALWAAAAVVVLLGAGGLFMQLRGTGASDSSDSEASVASASGPPPVLAPVQATDTNYTRQGLSAQVQSLIQSSQALQARPQSRSAQDNSAGSAESTPGASAFDGKATQGAAEPPGQLLRSQDALRACLKDIGADQGQPVAVDLARYAGREAAVIVLPADGGGYEVWVVARDCRPGSDGALDVVHVDK